MTFRPVIRVVARPLTHDDPSPRLGVEEALDHLVPLEVLALSTGVVHPDTLERDVLLLVVEPTGLGRVAGEEDQRGDAEDDGAGRGSAWRHFNKVIRKVIRKELGRRNRSGPLTSHRRRQR